MRFFSLYQHSSFSLLSFPHSKLLLFQPDSDEYVKKNVATLVREVCKHSPELAQLIVNAGGTLLKNNSK